MSSPAKDLASQPEKDATILVRWLDRLKKLGLGEARDDLLVIAAALYGVGYLVWALHASRYNLGLLPAIESQYFIAGIAPTLVIVVAYKLTVLVERGLDLIRKALGPDAVGWKRGLRVSIYGAFWGSLLLVFVSAVLERASSQLSRSMGQYAIWLFSASFFFLPEGEFRVGRFDFGRFYKLLMVRYLGVAIAILGIIFYSERVHSVLPQELGGGRPRCASLDLVRSQVSSQTLKALLPVSNTDTEAARSVDVDVFFAGGDYLLVKPRERGELDPTTYELRRADVRAITWCK